MVLHCKQEISASICILETSLISSKCLQGNIPLSFALRDDHAIGIYIPSRFKQRWMCATEQCMGLWAYNRKMHLKVQMEYL